LSSVLHKLQWLQRLLLSIKAELENVTDLVPASDAFEYFFKVCSINEIALNRLAL